MMKRFLSVLFVMVLMTLCACQGSVLVTRMDASGNASDKPASENALDEPPAATASSDLPEAEATQAPVETFQPIGDPVIEEQLLCDRDGLRITVLGYIMDEDYGPGISLRIENNSAHDLLITIDSVLVNGWSMDATFVSIPQIGEEVEESLCILQNDLDAAGIRSIGEIVCSFQVCDDHSYDELFISDPVSIRTSHYGVSAEPIDLTGDTVHDGNGIQIVILGLCTHQYTGLQLQLYIKNDTGSDFRITAGDLLLNGSKTRGVIYMLVPAGTQAIGAVSFLDDAFRELSPTDVSEICLDFTLYDENSSDTVLETETYSYKVG